ncbi:hypothetical protein EJ02DRAFT_458568 [Clathrospora elynae]|uniref:Uncharacterized protein n=1 Tax=Clathrospora elynae TaxID=706981 RepID=A0A6A5SDC0_9PLEO|nr:hypothetical protein EJ02DRAFT_458568 [Clathrospora elynae]
MSATTRRSTRRTLAEPAQSASEQRAPELPKKKDRKPKAAVSGPVESHTVTKSKTVLTVKATSRANAPSTAPAPALPRTTRASRAKAAEIGEASPQRTLEQIEPVKRRRNGRLRIDSKKPEPAPAQSEPAHDENNDEQGIFFSQKFDSNLMNIAEEPQAQPVFVNGSESALALLHKIENAAKQSARIEPSLTDSETIPHHDVTMQPSPQRPTKRVFHESTATPDRPIAPTPNIFSRSFSAIKSRLFSTSIPKAPSTPQLPSPAQVLSPTPAKPLPPQNSLTEALSVPPTPVGERVKTPGRRKSTHNSMMRVLLKGIDREDKREAEAWAKQVIPGLKNDLAFREKRRRLEATVLFKDLNHFPSAKPWETGFGDPLADLDDEDVVPGWAVYLDMMAEEEEHVAKKHKTTHEVTPGDDEIPSINEQYAASSSARTSPKLHNSHGQSASLYDFQPRRSIDPSPMFATPVSHHEGGNIFSELQGHDTATQIRENDREVLQHATEETVHVHDPGMGSFSVPDDSDEDGEDTTMNSEASDADAAPLWTQPPPPAPVPAHAPLPGGPVADAPSVPAVQQPVDEIERQRQRLMKHTPAKPSRLREATYPSPSLFSDAGNESILAATPVQITASVASMFADMPGAELIELDDECQAAFDELVDSDEYKQQVAANVWPAATLTYESDEEDLSPA